MGILEDRIYNIDKVSKDEIIVVVGGKFIYQLRGVRPFLSDKFDVTKYKNYKFLEDYDNENLFDVEEYLKKKREGEVDTKYNDIQGMIYMI